MRLSDAIALGRVLANPHSTSRLARCALGMAAMAVGIKIYPTATDAPYTSLRRQWPWLRSYYLCPCSCDRYGEKRDGAECIYHIFDSHIESAHMDWTLDRLIDWVRSVEPAEPPAPSLTEGANSLADARTERVAGEAKGVGV